MNKIKNFSPFLIPNYLYYSLIIIINNLFLVTTFFIVQVFYKHFIKQIILRTSPHMYLWRKQWNWMSSTMLFKQNRIV
ncbi:hypothetical protein [Spiroplasma ixodetis]|uniref:hypothetical protein n=1 Tax=Spiroplasma ixodetis TaxID=2141 RepID=UPI0025755D17|nr:hypothetical protein [Spiroplasma ixodetis]